MKPETYKLHRRARMVLNQLSDDEREQVLQTVASLADSAPETWPSSQAQRLAGEEPLYLVRINASLRAFVRARQGEEPEVQDVVRQETLDAFAGASKDAGNGSGA